MSSGSERVVINTLERLVSADANRTQSFIARDRAEVFRYLLDVSSGTDDLDAAGVTTEFVTQENPLRAEVLNGLLVRPQLASLNLAVDAGLLFCVDPDAAPSTDDSVYKFVRSAAVAAGSGLAMTANGAGSPRIDVIEVQRTGALDQVIETDSRDVFNPVTALFSATTLTKAVASTLTFRVRAGAPAGGFPGTAAGWLPLAVAMNPAGSTTCNDMTFWDVRPLVADRVRAFGNAGLATPRLRKSQWNALSTTAVAGLFEAELGGRRLGGRVRTGGVATDAQTVNLQSLANQDPTLTLNANRPWYLYACTPKGLPRWARYTDAASGSRVPRSPRGILVASTITPDCDGKPSSAVSLPSGSSLGGSASTSEAVCVAAGWADSGPAMLGFWGDDDGVMLVNGASAISVTGTNALPSDATLTANQHYPANARAIYLEIDFELDAAGAPPTNEGLMFLITYAPNGGAEVHRHALPYVEARFVAADPTHFVWSGWVPLPTVYPSTTPPTQKFGIISTGAVAPVAGATFTVRGWRL